MQQLILHLNGDHFMRRVSKEFRDAFDAGIQT